MFRDYAVACHFICGFASPQATYLPLPTIYRLQRLSKARQASFRKLGHIAIPSIIAKR